MSVEKTRTVLTLAATAALVIAGAPAGSAAEADPQLALRPIGADDDCRVHRLALAAEQGAAGAFAVRRELRRAGAAGADLRSWTAPDGTVFHYRADRLAPESADRPAALTVAETALADARRLLVDGLGLTLAERLELRLVELGPRSRGFAATIDERGVLLIDANGDVRRDTIHLLGHLALDGLAPARPPASWAEAFAEWVGVRLDGPDERAAREMSRRLARLDLGLFTERADLAGGGAVWLAYLDEAHGHAAVRFALDGLAEGRPAPEAFDLALRRTGETDLAGAIRDLQLWAVFTGERSDERHFSFADRLDRPAFASSVDGLPALAALSDPPLAAWGTAIVALHPDADRGGVRLVLDGDPGSGAAAWQADLLLLADGAAPRRLPLPMNGDGRGEITVPAAGLDEILLLVRNAGGEDDRAPRRYTYAAHLDRAYPYELTGFDAGIDRGAVQLSWDTSSERGLAGYNVLRRSGHDGIETPINPIRVPSLGDATLETSYGFLDPTVEPGRVYVYRLQGITLEGLTALSEPVVVRVPSH